METVKFSVVIPTLIRDCHQLETTHACIEAAKKNTKLPFELIIVETESNYLSRFSDIHVWEKRRTTSTGSCNRGFACATGDYVTLLTNDVLVDDGWLENLYECFQTKPDCGLSTLATTQFFHKKQDKIEQGIWFSVAMMPKETARFDPQYDGAWDDTDLIMATYLTRKRMYRNYKSVVDHKVGMTLYADPEHEMKFERNKVRFIKKWKEHQDSDIFMALVGGLVI